MAFGRPMSQYGPEARCAKAKGHGAVRVAVKERKLFVGCGHENQSGPGVAGLGIHSILASKPQVVAPEISKEAKSADSFALLDASTQPPAVNLVAEGAPAGAAQDAVRVKSNHGTCTGANEACGKTKKRRVLP